MIKAFSSIFSKKKKFYFFILNPFFQNYYKFFIVILRSKSCKHSGIWEFFLVFCCHDNWCFVNRLRL